MQANFTMIFACPPGHVEADTKFTEAVIAHLVSSFDA